MKKLVTKLIPLLVVLAVAISGCSMIVIDEEMDLAEAVAVVNGEVITKGEVQPVYESYVSMYQYYASLGITGYDVDNLAQVIVDRFVDDKVALQEAAKRGLDTFNDDELKEISDEAQTSFEEYIDTYRESFEEAGGTGEEVRQATIDYLAEMGVTVESLEKSGREKMMVERLYDDLTKEVEVTEEEIQAQYDANVEADEGTYKDNNYTFENAMSQGSTTVYWMPEGYRTVKHILLQFPTEYTDQIDDLNDQITAIEAQIDELDVADAEGDETDDPDTEEGSDAGADLQKQIDELNAEIAALNSQIDDIEEQAKEALKPRVEEIQERLANGESFEALMEEYGEDPGMRNEPTKTLGYYVSANSALWHAEFTEGAMALQNVGDVSEPVYTSSGMHLIRYESDVTPGAVPLSEVKDKLSESMLTTNKDAAYETALEELVAAADVKTYVNRIDK